MDVAKTEEKMVPKETDSSLWRSLKWEAAVQDTGQIAKAIENGKCWELSVSNCKINILLHQLCGNDTKWFLIS